MRSARRSSYQRAAQAPLAVVVVLLLLSGCGSDDKDRHKVAGKTTVNPAGPTFEAADVSFTFRYPRDFEQVDEPHDGKVLASVTPTPDDLNNGLKIRRTAPKELSFTSYASGVKSQFEKQLSTNVTVSEGKRGSLGLGVIEWRKAYTDTEHGERKNIRLRSKSYFFTGGGKTWQVECLSRQEYRAVIQQACQQALGSIAFP